MAYTTINDSSAHLQTALYTGNGSSNAITNDGNSNLRPDWLWTKNRSGTANHKIFDSARGVTKFIESDTSDAEGTQANLLSSLDSDGFTLGSGGETNSGSTNYVAWQWAAGGTAPTKTYRVVVVSDSGNKYRWRNSGNTATFAQSAVTLDLQEGGTYTIDGSDSTMASHPIKLSTTANGTHGGGSSYNTGVVYKLDGSTVTESAYVSGYATATTRQLVITVAASAPTLYYYCHYHSGMGGQINTNTLFGSTNFDGSVLSVVSVNSTAGFSIVRWTGTGSAITIGHGLSSAPQWITAKNLNNTGGAASWPVYHRSMGSTGAEYYMKLDTDVARIDSSGLWNDTEPTSTVFTANTSHQINASGGSFIAYCFTEVQGYSKFSGYTGSGTADGTFVYTGFKPSWLLIKRKTGVNHWHIFDDKRDPSNVISKQILADLDNAEGSNTWLDITATGFKLRTTLVGVNGAEDYVYMAFGRSPLVATNDVVSTAR
tara:strand:+ start:5439 stop:6896 length:1458 start_codon:yes stop_codon:yes gene_type:complete